MTWGGAKIAPRTPPMFLVSGSFLYLCQEQVHAMRLP